MWDSNDFDQWRSYLSLRTEVLLIFFVVWNLSFLFAIFVYGNGLDSPFSLRGGMIISGICALTCVFCLTIIFSKSVRNHLLEPKRLHNYRAKDFYLLAFITFIISLGIQFFTKIQSV